MSEYRKVKIGDFLIERAGRYKPDDKIITNCKRLEKIDFSGKVFISDKPTKTDMIIVYPGDLVISGINVVKGAIAVYQGKEPVCATIHYSSYIFDEKTVDLEYFKFFVKSDAFITALQKQVKGGIKTEIKPKHLLPLEIEIPDLKTQKQIANKIATNLAKINILKKEVELQKEYTKQLRQNILQDAIEGKLTAEWRQTHPVIKGNPDYDAEALYTLIQKEKKPDKRQKKLAPITDEEKPFEIPEGWKWVRLGEIIYEFPRNGYSPKAVNYITSTKSLKLGAVTNGIFNSNEYKYIDAVIASSSNYWLRNGDILIERSNSLDYVGICAIYTGKDKEFIYPDLLMKFHVSKFISNEFVHNALMSPFNRVYFTSKARGSQKTMPKINQETVINTLLPLVSKSEQIEIVQKITEQLLNLEQLEQRILQQEECIDKLVQGILKNAFDDNECDNPIFQNWIKGEYRV